jgi:hypothetical protein
MARLIIEGFDNVAETVAAGKDIAIRGGDIFKGKKVNMQQQPWLAIAYDGDVTIKLESIPGWKASNTGPLALEPTV